jgi:hypothetical protein
MGMTNCIWRTLMENLLGDIRFEYQAGDGRMKLTSDFREIGCYYEGWMELTQC